MISEPFLRPRLAGKRFEQHAIPLELLKDLAALEELIVAVAKAEFLRENPGRKRTPKGFTESCSLTLTAVEEGSAIPVIALALAATTLFPTETQRYFERARDSVVSAIWAAERGHDATQHLSSHTLNYFQRIGRSLRDNESIEFAAPSKQAPAKLTKDVRRRLLLASDSTDLTDDIEVRGAIPEVDRHDGTFEVQTVDGRKIVAPLNPEHLATVLEAFADYHAGARVLVSGVGLFSRADKLEKLESVHHVSTLDPRDISVRLEELSLLRDGWLDGEGAPLSPSGITRLIAVVGENFDDEVPLPFIYPTPEGNVRFEWSLAGDEMSLDVVLPTLDAFWHEMNLNSGDDSERSLQLGNHADWEWISARLRSAGEPRK